VVLAAREVHPEYRFGLSCRVDEAVEAALAELEWPVSETDPVTTGVESAFSEGAAPVAVIDREREILSLLAADGPTLGERVRTLRDTVETT
jgi:hypothetical protein